jgi:hypothetical protein
MRDECELEILLLEFFHGSRIWVYTKQRVWVDHFAYHNNKNIKM